MRGWVPGAALELRVQTGGRGPVRALGVLPGGPALEVPAAAARRTRARTPKHLPRTSALAPPQRRTPPFRPPAHNPPQVVKTDPEHAGTLVAAILGMIRLLAALVAPYVPSLTDKILEQLNLPQVGGGGRGGDLAPVALSRVLCVGVVLGCLGGCG